MKVLSLFDGMSVAQQALKNLGIKVDTYYASEVDPYAIAVTQSNFPDTIQLGDVEEVGKSMCNNCFDGDNHLCCVEECMYGKNIDILIGGSPCQDLSIAKKNREGLKGERSGLFWEYVRIRDKVKPKYFILENVASMPKEARDTISEALGVEPVMINASLVSAQNRKRLFWVGKWNGESYEQVEIPQPEDRGILLKNILEENVDEKYYVDTKKLNKDIRASENSSFDYYNNKEVPNNKAKVLGTNPQSTTAVAGQLVRVGSLNSGGQGDRIYSKEGKSVALSANGGGRGAKTGLYEVSGAASRTYPRTKISGQTRSKQIEIRDDGKANAMTSVQGDSMVAQETQIRKLTPTECLRLQSMPDNFFDKAEYKGKPISNTQRYKMCGNAFNCEVVSHIIKHLI